MERVEPRACLALLWGCLLAAAAAAQGKEGECARGASPARCNPGGLTPAPRDSRSPAGRRAQLWKPTWRRQPCRAGVGRARARRLRDESGTPCPRVRGPPGTKGWRLGVRGLEAVGNGRRRRPRGRSPAVGFRNASRWGRGGPLENGVSEELSANSASR